MARFPDVLQQTKRGESFSQPCPNVAVCATVFRKRNAAEVANLFNVFNILILNAELLLTPSLFNCGRWYFSVVSVD